MAWDYLRSPRFDPLDMVPANKSVLAFNLSFLFDHQVSKRSYRPRFHPSALIRLHACTELTGMHCQDVLQRAMKELLSLVRSGELKVAKVTTFPMSQAAEAHRALEGCNTTGKLVLDTTA
jgi:NADPH:quinone reductase-like Zn-dependent oxidoreductase